jgi:hypothetical protein
MSSVEALAGQAAQFIHATFTVSQEEASELGATYAGLISAHGGDPSSFDFENLRRLIVRRMNETHTWRDESVKAKLLKEQEQSVSAYQQFVDKSRSSPFKKW